MKKFILSLILTITLITSPANAEFFSDIIVTSSNAIWTDSRAYETLNDAIDAVGANERTIKIVSPQVVTTLTVPSNITLEFDRDGSITNSGQLTLNTKNIRAPNRQIFTGTGNIDFAAGSVVKTGWFSNIETAFALTTNDEITLVVSKPQTITANYSPGNDVHLKWEDPGNILTVDAGVVVGNLKNIEAGNFQIFAGAGDLDFLDGAELKLNWFNQLSDVLTWVENEEVTIIVNEDSNVQATVASAANENIKIIPGGKLTLPAGVDLTLVGSVDAASNVFDIDTTASLTINGPFSAGLYQVFSGDGSVAFGKGVMKKVYPQWWGALGDNSHDDSSAIQAAINSIPAAGVQKELGGGGIIYFKPGIYLCTTGIVNNGRKVCFIGSSIDNTTIKKNANIDLIKVDSYFTRQRIENMTLDGNSKTGAVIYLDTPSIVEIRNLRVQNNGGVATTDTDAALYFKNSTAAIINNVRLVDNTRNGYFNEIHNFNITKLGVYGGTVWDDMEFISCSGILINSMSSEIQNGNNGGVAFKGGRNILISKYNCEHSHSVNVITVGDTGLPVRSFTLRGMNVARGGDEASSKATILVQLSSMGINIENFEVQAVGTTGAHTGGWIELAEVRNVTLRNINAQDMNAVISAADLIKTSSIGPDYLTMDGVYAEGCNDTESMTIRADHLEIRNSNVPLTIDANSTYIDLYNQSGAITDNSGKAIHYYGGTVYKPYIDVASAAELNLPDEGEIFNITGNTGITSIAAADSLSGRKILLKFNDTLTVTDGNNLKLAGNFSATDGDTILLFCNGTNWHELSRSAN